MTSRCTTPSHQYTRPSCVFLSVLWLSQIHYNWAIHDANKEHTSWMQTDRKVALRRIRVSCSSWSHVYHEMFCHGLLLTFPLSFLLLEGVSIPQNRRHMQDLHHRPQTGQPLFVHMQNLPVLLCETEHGFQLQLLLAKTSPSVRSVADIFILTVFILRISTFQAFVDDKNWRVSQNIGLLV